MGQNRLNEACKMHGVNVHDGVILKHTHTHLILFFFLPLPHPPFFSLLIAFTEYTYQEQEYINQDYLTSELLI